MKKSPFPIPRMNNSFRKYVLTKQEKKLAGMSAK